MGIPDVFYCHGQPMVLHVAMERGTTEGEFGVSQRWAVQVENARQLITFKFSHWLGYNLEMWPCTFLKAHVEVGVASWVVSITSAS